MGESTAGGPPLFALDVPPLVGSLEETAAVAAVRRALSGSRSRTLWFLGPPGSGKTTSLAYVLEESSSGEEAVLRLGCFPSLRIEESIYRISDFLRQGGIDDLSRVLDQRSHLESKIGVLLELLAKHPVVIWWDDAERLEAGKSAGDQAARAAVLARLVTLPDASRGRVILSSASPPPRTADVEVVRLPPLDAPDARRIWQGLTGEGSATGPSPAAKGAPEETTPTALNTPLSLRLLAGLVTSGDGALPPDLRSPQPTSAAEVERGDPNGSSGVTPSLTDICEAGLRRLGPDSLALLEVVASFRRPLSRAALRDLCRSDEVGLQDDDGETDRRLAELESYRLVDLDRERRRASYCTIHPFIQEHVEARTRKLDRERWQNLLHAAALYLFRLGSISGDVWHHHRCHMFLVEAGQHEEASRTASLYLERALRAGYFDVALKALTCTVRTTTGLTRAVALGNMALVHKNHGSYQEALELYGEARRELELVGDPTNLARVLHQIGNTLFLKKDLEGALQSYRESHTLSAQTDANTIAAATRVQIGNVLWALERRDEAFREYSESLRELQDSGNGGLVAAVKLQIGQVHLESRRYIEAENAFREAEEEAERVNDRRGLLQAQRARGVAAKERREYDVALRHYEDAERTAVELGDLVEAISCKLSRGDVANDRGVFREAASLYLEARASIDASDTAGVISGEQACLVRAAVDERLENLQERMGEAAFRKVVEKRQGTA